MRIRALSEFNPDRWLSEQIPRCQTEKCWNAIWYAAFVIYFVNFSFHYLASDSGFFIFLETSRPFLWYGIFALLLIKLFFFSDYRVKELLLIGPTLLLLGISALRSGNIALLRSFIFVFSSRGISFDRVCRLSLGCLLACICSILIMTALGITKDLINVRTERFGTGAVRHSLGFDNPNVLAYFCHVTLNCLLLVRFRNMNCKLLAGSAVFILAVFALTNCKTSLICGFVVLALLFAASRCDFTKVPQKRLFVLLTGGIIAAVIIYSIASVIYNYQKDFLYLINVILSDRLNLNHMALQTFGVKLFGQQYFFGYPLDSLFFYVPITFGLIPCLLYYALCLLCLWRCILHKRYEIISAILVFLLYSFIEKIAIETALNVTLFAACADLECLPEKHE